MNDDPSTALARLAATLHSFGLVAAAVACCSVLAGTPAGAADATATTANVATLVAPSPAAPPSPSHRHRTVFTCHEQGVTVLSDRPCGPLSVTRSVTTEAPPPGTVATTVPPVPRASIRPRVEPARDIRPDRGNTDRCAALRRELSAVDDRMRAGYAARESARLWDRWRGLKDRLRRERC